MEITEETRAFRAPMVARLWLLHIVAIVSIVLRIDFVLAGNSWPVHSKTYAVIQLVAIQNYANVSQDLPPFRRWTSFCRSSAFCATKAWLSERNCAWTWRGIVEIVCGMHMGTGYVVELVISVLGCSKECTPEHTIITRLDMCFCFIYLSLIYLLFPLLVGYDINFSFINLI